MRDDSASRTPPPSGYKGLFVKNTLLSVAHQLISILAAFFLMPYMIWRMGDEGYGLWMILKIFNIGGYLSLAGMGFQDSIVRYLAKYHVEGHREAFKTLYCSGLMLFFVIGVICCLAVLFFNRHFFLSAFGIATIHAREMQLCLVVYACSFLYEFPSLVLKAFYTSRQDFFSLKLWETLNVLTFTFLVLVVMSFSESILSVVLVETAVYFTLFVVFLCLPFRRCRSWYALGLRHFSLRSLRNVSGMTSYVFFSRISSLVYTKTPEVIIGCFLAPSSMTHYAIISRIPRTIKVLQGVVNSAVLPVAVAFETLNYRDKMKTLFLRGTRYSFLFLTPIVVFTVVCAEDFLRLWIGSEYAFLANLLRAYVLWQYFMLLVAFGSSMYTQKEHFKYLLPYTLLANVVFLSAAIVFARRLELWSILLGLGLSGCITTKVNISLIHKINGFSLAAFFDYVLKVPVIVGASVCLVVLLLLKIYAPFSSIWVLIVYAGLMYVSYLALVYRYGLFDFERSDIKLLLQKL